MGKMNEISVLAWNAGIKTDFMEVSQLKILVAKQLLLCRLQPNVELLRLAIRFEFYNKDGILTSQKELAQKYTGIRVQEAMSIRKGTTIYHHLERNADGSAMRVRMNGACQTWKTRPADFRLPVIYGLKNYGQITHDNGWEWFTL